MTWMLMMAAQAMLAQPTGAQPAPLPQAVAPARASTPASPSQRIAIKPDMQAPLDPALESCLGGQKLEDDAQSYVTHCYRDAFDRANAELDKGFTALAARMTRDGLSGTDARDASDHWHAYRDAWCRIERAGEPDAPSRDLTELQCRTEISQRLLARMRNAWQR